MKCINLQEVKMKLNYCICNQNNIVIEQSPLCIQMCGDRKGASCTDGCREHLKNCELNSGSIMLKNRTVHQNQMDIVCYSEGEEHVIILTKSQKQVFKIAELKNLTSKEREVANLINKGYSNKEILENLNISKSTLKTHINHIYQKLNVNFQAERKSKQQ